MPLGSCVRGRRGSIGGGLPFLTSLSGPARPGTGSPSSWWEGWIPPARGRSQLSSKKCKTQPLLHSPELGCDTPSPMGKGTSDASVQFQKSGDISHPQIIIMIFCNYYLCILHNCHNYYHQLISLPSQHALLLSSALKSDHMGHTCLPLTSS